MRTALICACAGLVACSREPAGPEAADVEFARGVPGISLVQLPMLAGASGEAYAVNDAGEAVGHSVDESNYLLRAVRWTNKTGRWVIETVGPPGVSSAALAINEAGTMAGRRGRDAAVWRRDGSLEIIGVGEALGINGSDMVVGHWSGPTVWVRTSAGWTTTILAELPGGATSQCVGAATDIAEDGTIVGMGATPDCRYFAVVWRRNADNTGWERAERLPVDPGAAQSYAQGIAGSTVVGAVWPCAVVEGCRRQAFEWTLAGGVTGPLGTLDARANGLNATGLIVGSYEGPRLKAFVWSAATRTVLELPTIKSSHGTWAWEVSNATPARATRLAVGAASTSTSPRVPLLWIIP